MAIRPRAIAIEDKVGAHVDQSGIRVTAYFSHIRGPLAIHTHRQITIRLTTIDIGDRPAMQNMRGLIVRKKSFQARQVIDRQLGDIGPHNLDIPGFQLFYSDSTQLAKRTRHHELH
jgi:hypothetical protein